MPEEKIAGIMREFVKAVASGRCGKINQLTSADDPVYVTPYGTTKARRLSNNSCTAMVQEYERHEGYGDW